MLYTGTNMTAKKKSPINRASPSGEVRSKPLRGVSHAISKRSKETIGQGGIINRTRITEMQSGRRSAEARSVIAQSSRTKHRALVERAAKAAITLQRDALKELERY